MVNGNKLAGGSGPCTASSSSNQETLNDPLHAQIDDIKKHIQSHRDDLNTLSFYSAVIYATINAVSFVGCVKAKLPISEMINSIRFLMYVKVAPVFKDMRRIVSDAILNMKKQQQQEVIPVYGTIEFWRNRCRHNLEELERTIKKEFLEKKDQEVDDQLRVEVLNVITRKLMPVMVEIVRRASGCRWEVDGEKVLEDANKLLKSLETEVFELLTGAVFGAMKRAGGGGSAGGSEGNSPPLMLRSFY